MKSKNPELQIKRSNPWYTDSQFTIQMGTPGRKLMIENRWRFFENAIILWAKCYVQPESKIPSIKVLDAGCGDGINLFGLSRILNKLPFKPLLIGVDYNTLRTSRAKKLKSEPKIVNSLLKYLPFQNNSFNIILFNHTLEHIPNDKQALLEIKRVLHSSGLLILGVPNEGCFLGQLRNRIIQPNIQQTTDHINFYTTSKLKELFLAIGLKIMEIKREGFFIPHDTIWNLLNESRGGRTLLKILRICFPQQAAGLLLIVKKS